MAKMTVWVGEQDLLIGSKVVAINSDFKTLQAGKEYDIIDIDETNNQIELEGFGWINAKYFMLSKNDTSLEKINDARDKMFEYEDEYLKYLAKVDIYRNLLNEAKAKMDDLQNKHLKAKEEYYDMIKEAQEAVIK